MNVPTATTPLCPEVAIIERERFVYLTDGSRVLRLPNNAETAAALGVTEEPVESHARKSIIESLRSEGFAADEPSAAEPYPVDGPTGVARQLSDLLTLEALVPCGGAASVRRFAVPKGNSIVAVSLRADPEFFRAANLEVIGGAADRLLVHLVGHRKLFAAVLRPPRTPCLACLTIRLRANTRCADIRDANLGVLLAGTAPDGEWLGWELARTKLSEIASDLFDAPPDAATLVEYDVRARALVVHPILRTPYCIACHPEASPAAQAASLAREALCTAARTPLAESAARLRRLCDPLTGVVGRLKVRPQRDVVTLAMTVGATDTTLFSEVRAPAFGGSGKPDELHAKVAALGEAAERYACGVYKNSDLVEATYRKLGDAAIDPRSYPLGSAADYRRAAGSVVELDPDAPMRWAEVVSLHDGRRLLLPAAFIYLPYRGLSPKERIWRPISTGLAAGSSLTEAVLAGLYEIIERDAMVIMWKHRLPVPMVRLSGSSGAAAEVLDRFRTRGVQVTCKWTTTDVGVPSVLAMAYDPVSQDPLVAFAERADLDPHECVAGAVAELEQARDSVRQILADGPPCPPDRSPVTMDDHFAYYCLPERVGRLDFLWEGPTMALPAANRVETAGQEVDRLLDRLAAAGFEAFCRDLTTPDLREVGISVVRVIVPGMQPVTFGVDFMHLGGGRLYEAPVRMGYHDRPVREEDLNPDPIP